MFTLILLFFCCKVSWYHLYIAASVVNNFIPLLPNNCLRRQIEVIHFRFLVSGRKGMHLLISVDDLINGQVNEIIVLIVR
jgi:hypothetical protein